jgi:uncharacterized YccA/Bax inhibitor family protein
MSRRRSAEREERGVKSSNPVLGHLDQATAAERRSGYGSGYGSGGYQPAQYQSAPPVAYGPTGYGGYGQPPVMGVREPGRAMALDDVVTRTLGLVVVVVAAATLSWIFLRTGGIVGIAVFGSAIAGLVVGLVISFRVITNPPLIITYAILQGILLGVVSRAFEQVYPGVVLQAVVGTLAVFLAMAVLYRFRVLRATPRFARWVIGALIGVIALSVITWIMSAFGHGLGLEPGGQHSSIGFIIALVFVGVAALTFILDFNQVEQAVRYGLPERFAWYCAFGLVVGLIFLYWQILRLLGYLRN